MKKSRNEVVELHTKIDKKRDNNLRYLKYKEKKSLRSLVEIALDGLFKQHGLK